MCSRYMKKQTDITLSEKPKIKTVQMKNPAPHSQSWSGTPQLRKSTHKTSAQKLVPRQEIRQRHCHGPDPTVPHLKYGLFPKKRAQSRTLTSNSTQESNKSETITRTKYPKEGDSSAPLFVVRAVDSRLTRRLTRAASTHLDIKPRNSF